MARLVFCMLIAVLLFSCDVSRDVHKEKSSLNLDENIERQLKRRGDTVVYRTQLHLKDTTVYTVNKYGTTLKTVYDKTGQVAQTDCYASAMDVLEKITRNLQQRDSIKDKTETAGLSDTLILGLIGGVVVVFCFGFFLLQRSVNKNFTAIREILNK